MPMADDKIPKGRIRRSAKLGSALGAQATRYAGTKAANVARSERASRAAARGAPPGDGHEDGRDPGRDEGSGDEARPARLLRRHRVPAARVRGALPGGARQAAHLGAGDAVGEGRARSSRRSTAASRSTSCSPRSSRRPSPPPRSARCTAPTLHDGRAVAVKIQYPGVAEALESDLRNAGMIMRLARALAPGLDAKAVAEELRLRVMEELDYEYEAQSQRTFARAYRGHPFIYVPDVLTRLSRRRVLVTEYVEGLGFEDVKRLPQADRDRFGEIVFRFSFGSIYHLQQFNADPHPGNYILMPDARVAFLDFGMTKRLDLEQIELEQRAIDAAVAPRPGGAPRGAARPRLRQEPVQARRRAADGARDGGRRLVHGGPRGPADAGAGDEGDRVHLRPALAVLRPDAPREHPRRGADGPADGDGRAGGAGAAAGERATGTGSCGSGSTATRPPASWASWSGPTSRSAASAACRGSPSRA